MYSDLVDAVGKRSVKERLNGNSGDDSTRRRQITGKRQRQDDKWEHDLYDDDARKVSYQKVGAQDLRLKLQRKSMQQSSGNGRGSLSGVRDLREKLSGTMNSQPRNTDPPKPKPVQKAIKPIRNSVAVEASPSETKHVSNSLRKKTQQKMHNSVDDFLHSLDLEKYSITFQAEEVDMTALVHMTDEDLRVLGIPMGPRKKILLALESRI